MTYPQIPGQPPAPAPYPMPGQPPAPPQAPATYPMPAAPVPPITYGATQGFTPPQVPAVPAPVAYGQVPPGIGYTAQPGSPAGYAATMAPQAAGVIAGQFAPQALPQGLGDAIAGATIGIQRRPPLPEGDHLVEIEQTFKPAIAAALIAEFTVVESTNPASPPGFKAGWYQGVGNPDMRAQQAQNGAILGFVVAAGGFATKEAMNQHLNGGLGAFVLSCFTAPGPLAKRLVRVSVRNTGKLTRPKYNQMGQQVAGGQPIFASTWSPYTG